MRKTSARLLTIAALMAAVVCIFTEEAASADSTVSFASGTDWLTFNTDPGAAVVPDIPSALGPAQLVCMTLIAPPSCPPGATVYNSPFYGWTADLTPIAGAHWIWRPGIDGTSTPADLADYFFSKAIIVRGRPTGGTIYVAVDDYAAIRVNEQLVATLGSVVDASLAGKHTHLTAFDITSYLRPGRNVITVEAQNGPAYFSGLCNPCSYALNPAGVVFGGSISFVPGDTD
jgi:hypothetical protein